MPEEIGFASWQSYWRFRQEVMRQQRYLLSDESKAFLEELARTSKSRLGKIDAGKHFCRAQIAHQDVEHPHAGSIPGPALPNRMTPLPEHRDGGARQSKGHSPPLSRRQSQHGGRGSPAVDRLSGFGLLSKDVATTEDCGLP